VHLGASMLGDTKKLMKSILSLLIASLAICELAFAEPAERSEISSTLMRSTFKIMGLDAKGGSRVGTVFILGQPDPSNPAQAFFILITAAHVLDDIVNDSATLFLRKRTGETFSKHPFELRVRDHGKPLWVKHGEVDIAAMRVSLPTNADISILPTTLLAEDASLERFEVHPGDELFVLGYPYGVESNEAGFPILRSGHIASFPLVPTKTSKTFLLDFEVFEGNSGGPVFLYSQSRVYGGGTHAGSVRMLMGVVSQERSISETVKTLDQVSTKRHKLAIAVCVHASFIRELIEKLPSAVK
jgi:S1-C subfamily serine protease